MMNKVLFFLIGGCNTMNKRKDKIVAFRMTTEQYERLMTEKPSFETVNRYILRKLFVAVNKLGFF